MLTNKSKKILFLIPTLIAGGMERVMTEIVNYCAENKNDEIHLILYGRKHEIFYKLHENVKLHIFNIEYLEQKRFIYTIKTFFYLRNEIKKINPDTILSFGELWNSFVLLSVIGLKYPIYISDRCQPDKRFSQKHEILRKWLYPQAKGVIVQTKVADNIYKYKFKIRNTKIIANPIREIGMDNQPKKENLVISIGRLINSKHYDRLINIFASINNPEWKLIIVGGDALKQNNSIKLQNQVKELGKENTIIFAGAKQDVEFFLLKSKIFAFTSSSEGFPNVIGEAMSSGLPVISYDCIAGPSEMIENGENGYLIPLFEDSLFEDRLKFLMNNDNVRKNMGEKAKESVKKFDSDIICEKFYQFIVNNE